MQRLSLSCGGGEVGWQPSFHGGMGVVVWGKLHAWRWEGGRSPFAYRVGVWGGTATGIAGRGMGLGRWMMGLLPFICILALGPGPSSNTPIMVWHYLPSVSSALHGRCQALRPYSS